MKELGATKDYTPDQCKAQLRHLEAKQRHANSGSASPSVISDQGESPINPPPTSRKRARHELEDWFQSKGNFFNVKLVSILLSMQRASFGAHTRTCIFLRFLISSFGVGWMELNLLYLHKYSYKTVSWIQALNIKSELDASNLKRTFYIPDQRVQSRAIHEVKIASASSF